MRLASIVLILGLLVAGGPSSVVASPPTCLGRTPAEWQAAGYRVVVGTAGNDTLQANWQKNVLIGLAGDDTLIGSNSNDVLCGGPGMDWLNGGNGINVLIGGEDADVLMGGPKRDDMVGGEVVDLGAATVPPDATRPGGWLEGTEPHNPDPRGGLIYAFGKVFQCAASDGDDQMYEGAGGGGEEPNVGPRMYGCAGDDYLSGGDGDEWMFGGDGNDWLDGAFGNDWMDGGSGSNYCDGGANQGTVHAGGVWRTDDSVIAGCDGTVVNVP